MTSHDQSQDKSIEALLHAELLAIPIALGILFSLVRRWRLLILAPLVLFVSFLTACCIVLPVTWWTDFSVDIPPAMLSVTIALSLDYSLFMLTRFIENRDVGMPLQDNVAVMVRYTAHTIGVSAMLIAVAFFGAVTIPEKNLQAAGVCLGFTTLAILLVNASLTPALLLLLGRLLTVPLCSNPCEDKKRRERDVFKGKSPKSTLNTGRPGSERMGKASLLKELEAGLTESERSWLWFMRCIERCPCFAVLLVLLIFSPLLVHLQDLHASADAYAMLPEVFPSVIGLREMVRHGFPVGRFDPFVVVVSFDSTMRKETLESWETIGLPAGSLTGTGDWKEGAKSAMLCPYAYDIMLELAYDLHNMTDVVSMLGEVWLMDKPVDFDYAKKLTHVKWGKENLELRRLYTAVLATHANQMAAALQVHTQFMPRGKGAAEWVEEARGIIAAWNEKHKEFFATIGGGASEQLDIRDYVLAAIPKYLGATVVGVMLFVVCMFWSILLPFRLAFALLFTLAATFSFAVLVYQTPLLHGFFPSLEDYYGLSYSSIPIATCIAIALGLDYDIFLISRIVEYRMRGLTDRDSIVYGVAKTGGIISGAGLIMAVAFSGLLFAKKLMLQQFAVLLIVSVLLDTFVVRTVLVPAMMLSAGGWNWFPYSMPAPHDEDQSGSEYESEPEED